MRSLRRLAPIAILLGLASCKLAGKPQALTDLAPEAKALRAAFNQDADKVRVVMLVAPT